MGLNVFLSYAHRDALLVAELKRHLSSLQHEGLITVWHDREVNPGAEWEAPIASWLSSAQIILLLISADFLNSDYCYGYEAQRAIEQHQQGKSRVIPVILRPVYWNETPLASLKALPTHGKPVTSWENLNEAFEDVIKGIREVASYLQSQQELAKVAPIDDTELHDEPAYLIRKKFNESLRRERQQRGWTQAEVAKKLEIDIKTVTRWERGNVLPDSSLLNKLCELFNKKPEELGFIEESR